MDQEESQNAVSDRPPNSSIGRIRDVDLSKIGRKLQVILENEINLIYLSSRDGSLDETSHKKFLNYLKFLPELREQEDQDLDDLSTEELEAMQNKSNKKGENHG